MLILLQKNIRRREREEAGQEGKSKRGLLKASHST